MIATDGRRALDAFAAHRPDVVITDIMLPAMNGVDVARTVRAMSNEVAVVGYSSVARLARAQDRAAFDAWVERTPQARPEELVSVVRDLLDRRRSAGH